MTAFEEVVRCGDQKKGYRAVGKLRASDIVFCEEGHETGIIWAANDQNDKFSGRARSDSQAEVEEERSATDISISRRAICSPLHRPDSSEGAVALSVTERRRSNFMPGPNLRAEIAVL